jgi:predicted HNH restriction endonuclease
LRSSQARGRKVGLADLAVVCANCHAMIHRWGECRKMESLRVRRA